MRARHRGFSLVEIMVGLAIGMIAMIVIMQVFDLSEKQKRTTSGGADAQSNGAIALYMIERDTRMAGWGMDSAMYASCNTAYSYCDGSEACGGEAGALGVDFAPVRIADGGSNPDTITIRLFADPNLDTFKYPASTAISKSMPQPSSELDVVSVAGCVKGGMVLVSQAGNCTLMQITHIQGKPAKLQHAPGSSGIYNPPANFQNANGWPGYTAGAALSCFPASSNGPLLQKVYAIDTASRQLQRTDNTVTPAVTNEPVTAEIFDLQAQYGIAPVNSQTVDEWVDATGATWANPALADWKRIKAVRIALVARSAQYEKPARAGDACTTTTDEMAAKWASWADDVFSTDDYPSDWRCYRYKTFETVIPLRNVIWGNL